MRLVPHFLVEIHMAAAGQLELERATPACWMPHSPAWKGGMITRTIVAGLSREDDRLLYLIEAGGPTSARRLFAVALLPAGRIPRDHAPRRRTPTPCVDIQEAMLTLELKPSLLRML